MAATNYLSPISLIVQYLTNLGFMAQGGQLNTYVGGSVSTPLTTFTDATGLANNPNPMTLNQAGRPATASGAPTEFWAPSGSLIKLVVTDAQGNQLVYLDNLPLLNDPASPGNIAGLLVNTTSPPNGASLVANAPVTYGTVANVQASAVPTLASGQTLVIVVEGQTSVGDALAGLYYWSATSNAADDNGLTTITPNLAAPAPTGRYLRLWGSEVGSFLGTLSGFTATVQGTFNFVRVGHLVALYYNATNPLLTGTSNAASMNLSGMPPSITPPNAISAGQNGGIVGGVTDNGVSNTAYASWNGSVISFFKVVANPGTGVITFNNALTGSGTKALGNFFMVYSMA